MRGRMDEELRVHTTTIASTKAYASVVITSEWKEEERDVWLTSKIA